MPQKVCYLLTSPEKFQQQRGNGCSNTDSPSHTGKKMSAILQAPTASSSKSESPLRSPSGDSFRTVYTVLREQGMCRISHYNEEGDFLWSELRPLINGLSGETVTATPKSSGLTREKLLSWLKTSSQPTKSDS